MWNTAPNGIVYSNVESNFSNKPGIPLEQAETRVHALVADAAEIENANTVANTMLTKIAARSMLICRLEHNRHGGTGSKCAVVCLSPACWLLLLPESCGLMRQGVKAWI